MSADRLYVLWQMDYEESLVLGIFTTAHKAEAARETLWAVFETFPVRQRFSLRCPFPAWQVAHKSKRLGLGHVAQEQFETWHPIEPMQPDSLVIDLPVMEVCG